MTEQDESLESQEELEAAEVDANTPAEEEQQDHAPNEDDVPEEADAEAGADESEEEEASSEPADADDADEGDGDADEADEELSDEDLEEEDDGEDSEEDAGEREDATADAEESGEDAADEDDPVESGDGSSEELDMDDVETDMDAYEEVDESALLDFTKVRPQIEAIVERNEADEARQLLEQISRFPDNTRHIEDNVWLYRLHGDLCNAAGDTERALESYRAAYSFDPRELALLRPFSKLLFEQAKVEEALRVFQSLLLYHKRKLDLNNLVSVYRYMGGCYEQLERPDKARASYEKALEQSSQDPQALDGLLRVVADAGDSQEIVKVRQRLIRSLEDPSARSSAMVALGDDWVEHFNDPARGLDTYEQALNEDPNNRRAVERIAAVATESEDWRRVSRSYFTLSRMADDTEEEADWLIKASLIARDQLWEPEKALTGFKRALSLDPTRLDAFKIVTSILVDSKEWEELKGAYINLIAALKKSGSEDTNLLVVLWQNLGELYHTHLENKKEAVVAFDQASRLMPRNVEMHEKITGLTEKDGEFLDMALEHLAALRVLQPGDYNVLDRIGRVYLRKKEIDHAYCVFRSLDYLGAPLDDKAKGFVGRFQKPIYKAPKQALTFELMQRYIFSNELDSAISKVFTLIKPPLAEWAGQTRSKYGLRRRDRIKLDEPLTFNNIYRSVGDLLQYPNLPELWRKPEQDGLINGALVPDGMIVGDEMLGSGREKHVAFVIGKQLFLFLAPFYLAAIRHSDLPAYFMLAMNLSFPDRYNVPLQGDMQSAHKMMGKAIRGEQFARLQKAVQVVMANQEGSDFQVVGQFVTRWTEAVEDSANRAGFIFCDDLKVCEDYLNAEAQQISRRSVSDRMRSLAEFSMSDEYVELRSILGINVA